MSESILGDVAPAAPAAAAAPAVPAVGGTPIISTAPDWLKGFEGIDEELINDPSLKPIKDVNGLIKSYVNAQRLVGADKVIVPKANADKSEWDAFYSKLGKPENLESFKLDKTADSMFDDAFLDKFKATAYELNILPAQAQKLYEAMNGVEREATSQYVEQAKVKYTEAVTGLKTKYGEAFDQKIGLARTAVMELGGEDFQKYLRDTGMGNDPKLTEMFIKIGEMISKEDNVGGGSPKSNTLTPDEARSKYHDIMNDPNDSYHDNTKIGHKARIDEVGKIFAAMHPNLKR